MELPRLLSIGELLLVPGEDRQPKPFELFGIRVTEETTLKVTKDLLYHPYRRMNFSDGFISTAEDEEARMKRLHLPFYRPSFALPCDVESLANVCRPHHM
jgi:hypothetical protein